MHPPIQFIYFDLGNVLLYFQQPLICKQVAEVAGVSQDTVEQFFAQHDYQTELEHGLTTFDDMYEKFTRFLGKYPSKQEVQIAASSIFQLNVPIVPVVAALSSAGHRLGILSNTSEAHWQYVTDGRYALVPQFFEQCVLSFEVHTMKPDREIYDAATAAAGTPRESIFFVDDRPENVEGALAAGWQAEQFTSVATLTRLLHERGLRFNF